MNKDPNYFLQRANFFYQRAQQNGNEQNEVDNELVDDELIMDEIDDDSDDFEYEYIKIEPNVNSDVPNESIVTTLKIKPQHKRYFDPVTRHYYKTDRMLENINTISLPKGVGTNAEIWYPENKLSYKTTIDPKTGRFYRVNKIYDDKGKYSYSYDKLTPEIHKRPGSSFYKPFYRCNKNKCN